MPPLTFLGPVNTGDTYEAKDGFKKTGFTDTSFLLAGGGTTLVANFATYTNIASLYYTKTESDTKFVPYTGATSNVNLGTRSITSTGGFIGNATTASTLVTARTIALSGGATGTATSFNGSANITIPVTALDASKLTTGTVPDARLTGVYTGFTHRIDGANTIFTTPSSGTSNASARTAFGVAEYRASTSGTVGAIVFIAPFNSASMMKQMEIEGMLYSPSNIVKIIINNYSAGLTKQINLGSLDIPVRIGQTADSKFCIILGDVTTSWSYPHFILSRVMMSHSAVSDAVCYGWSVKLETDLTGYLNVYNEIANSPIVTDITGNATTTTTLITARNINGTSFNGSADIVTSYWGTARNLTIGSTTKSVNGSANVAWSLAEIGAAAASHTHTIAQVTGLQTALDGKFNVPTGTTSQYVRGDGTLATFPTISVYNGIGPGLVPARGAGGTTTKFLNETGSWVIPPDTTYSVGTVSNIENGDTTAKVWTGETIHEYALNNYIEQTHAANSITATLISNWNEAYGWGNHSTAGYALANGSNASGTWENSSNGLENNPTLPGKTMAGSVTSSLQDANNGAIAGYLNSYGTAAGNPDANWWYRIKMLHPNSAGYNGEIAVQMTGSLSMMYRRMEAGFESGWIKTLDEATNSFISGMNSFRTTGNQYDSMTLHAYSDTAASPAIAFHKAGVYAGSIAMVSSTMYQFRNLAGTGLVNTQVSVSYASNGFVHSNVDSPDSVLTSDGAVADLDIDIVNDSGSLVIQDYFEVFDVNNTFNGTTNPNKLVYLVCRDTTYLEDLIHGQRIVLMNSDPSNDIGIYIDDNYVYTLGKGRKVTFYVETYSSIHIFDDSEYIGYTF